MSRGLITKSICHERQWNYSAANTHLSTTKWTTIRREGIKNPCETLDGSAVYLTATMGVMQGLCAATIVDLFEIFDSRLDLLLLSVDRLVIQCHE